MQDVYGETVQMLGFQMDLKIHNLHKFCVVLIAFVIVVRTSSSDNPSKGPAVIKLDAKTSLNTLICSVNQEPLDGSFIKCVI